jgi:hypothetical protein
MYTPNPRLVSGELLPAIPLRLVSNCIVVISNCRLWVSTCIIISNHLSKKINSDHRDGMQRRFLHLIICVYNKIIRSLA